MALSVAGFVVVCEDPAFLDVEPGDPPVLVFPVADASTASYLGQVMHVDRLLVGEVICRGDLARQTGSAVQAGAVVRVAGRLDLHAPLDCPRDGSVFVSMAIEAEDVAVVELNHSAPSTTS